MSQKDSKPKSAGNSSSSVELLLQSKPSSDLSNEPTALEEQDSLVGQSIGRYQILEHIAKGGTATVYRALDTTLKREVAVKILHEHLEAKKDIVERFKKEAMLIAQLRHPNVLNVFDFFDFNGRAVLVVEYMPGFTLSGLIKGTPKVPESIVLMITREILLGLRAAHEKGIIHRDIKPANILMHPELGVKITDFGLAKIAQHDDGLTKDGVFVGTPSFSSPEQIEGRSVDHRSDIFSLGLTIYILATRAHAFKQKGDSTTTVWFKIVKGKFEAVRNIDPTLSPEIEKLLNRALQVDVNRRYQTTSEMLAEVEEILAKRGITHYQTRLSEYLKSPMANATTSAKPKKVTGRSWRWAVVGMVIALIVAGGLLWKFRNSSVKPEPGLEQQTPTEADAEPPKTELSVEEPAPPEIPPNPETVLKDESEAKKTAEPKKVEPKKPEQKVIVRDPLIPEAIDVSDKLTYVVADAKNVPGYRWKANPQKPTEVSIDSNFTKIVAKSQEGSKIKELKTLSPGEYFWRGGAGSGKIRIIDQKNSRKQKITKKLQLVVSSVYQNDVDLQLNPWTQELKFDWTSSGSASSYKLEVATDSGFNNLLFSGIVVQKNQTLSRLFEKSEKIYWRVTFYDEKGNVFNVDPTRSLLLSLQGHSQHFDILTPLVPVSNGLQIRASAPAGSIISCHLRTSAGADGPEIVLKDAGTLWTGVIPKVIDSGWLLCRLNDQVTIIPVKR